MTPRGRAGWLPSALLLLQLPGCLSLSGPRSMTGIVGGSMSVECQYQEAFVDNIKYWCKHPCVSPWKIVETRESEREVRRGRVSIRDCPASLTFTVTLESLREEDAGTYGCGIYVPLSRDPTFQVEVSVIPALLGGKGGGDALNLGACCLAVFTRVRSTLKVTLCLFLDFSGQPYGAGTSRASRGHCSVVEGSWGPSLAVVVLGVCSSCERGEGEVWGGDQRGQQGALQCRGGLLGPQPRGGGPGGLQQLREGGGGVPEPTWGSECFGDPSRLQPDLA
nr:PREDICTED: CMRF35-like molecule 4 [Bos mutus]